MSRGRLICFFTNFTISFHPYELCLIGHVAAGVAVGVHEHLSVGVEGDEGLEVAVARDRVHLVLHLNLRVS